MFRSTLRANESLFLPRFLQDIFQTAPAERVATW